MLAIARTIYAKEWTSNASVYQAQGLYDMLAEQVAQAGELRAVLDVGCGLGQGIAALRKALPGAPHLIGVDENPDCLEAAASLLKVDGPLSNIRRVRDAVLESGRYVSTYDGPLQMGSDCVTFVQSDVIVRDPELECVLDDVGPLCAVTLWFSGIHKARSATELIWQFEIKNDADHRTLVEDRVLAIACERVRPGGVLQLVTRAGALDIDQVANDVGLDYADWLRGTPFRIETVRSIAYTEPTSGIVVRSKDVGVSAMPNYAISILIRREG